MNRILSVSEVKASLLQHLDQEKDWNNEVRFHIIKVFQGYGKRDGLFDQLSGMIYRIWNAIKSLFGQSDWQRAKRAIIEYQNISEYPQIKIALAMDFDGTIRQHIRKIESALGEGILTAYVKSTYFAATSSEEVDKKFREQLVLETNTRTNKVKEES